MSRPEGSVPATLEFTDADARRYFTDPLFHAQVYCVAQLAHHVYGVDLDEATAFGMQIVNAIENVARNGQPEPMDGS